MRSTVFNDRNLSSTDCRGSKGSSFKAVRTEGRSQEKWNTGTRPGKAVRPRVGSECKLRHLPGSMAGQGAREEPVAEQKKKETKDSPPSPPPGEGVVCSPSPEEQDPRTPGRLSQGRRLPWRFTGLAGAETG